MVKMTEIECELCAAILIVLRRHQQEAPTDQQMQLIQQVAWRLAQTIDRAEK